VTDSPAAPRWRWWPLAGVSSLLWRTSTPGPSSSQPPGHLAIPPSRLQAPPYLLPYRHLPSLSCRLDPAILASHPVEGELPNDAIRLGPNTMATTYLWMPGTREDPRIATGSKPLASTGPAHSAFSPPPPTPRAIRQWTTLCSGGEAESPWLGRRTAQTGERCNAHLDIKPGRQSGCGTCAVYLRLLHIQTPCEQGNPAP
jgi:hypothetical protein